MRYFESESPEHAHLLVTESAEKQTNKKIGILFGTLTATLLVMALVVGTTQKGREVGGIFKSWLQSRPDGMPNKGYYKLLQTAQSQSEAAAICASSGGELATIDTARDLVAARQECSSTAGCYIGLVRSAKSGIYVWGDGSPMVVQNWLTKGDARRPCVELIGKGMNHGKWRGIKCMGRMRPPLCMQRKKLFYRVAGLVSSSSEYNALCRTSGGEMAVILNAEENAAAVRACVSGENPNPQKKSGCWIGMARDPVSYHFIWLDGTGVCFQNWAEGQPTVKDKEGCAKIGPSGGWSDLPCVGQALGVLCQTKP